MDEGNREVFKTKFIALTILLNIVILCIAMGVFALCRYSSSAIGLAAGVALIAAGLLTSVAFRRKYLRAKLWLEENA